MHGNQNNVHRLIYDLSPGHSQRAVCLLFKVKLHFDLVCFNCGPPILVQRSSLVFLDAFSVDTSGSQEPTRILKQLPPMSLHASQRYGTLIPSALKVTKPPMLRGFCFQALGSLWFMLPISQAFLGLVDEMPCAFQRAGGGGEIVTACVAFLISRVLTFHSGLLSGLLGVLETPVATSVTPCFFSPVQHVCLGRCPSFVSFEVHVAK